MIDNESLSLQYFQNEIPCPYKLIKGTELKIYPIIVSDYMMYLSCRGIMEIDKNAKGDVQTIQMSYLGFLVNKVFNDEDSNLNRFLLLLKLILHEEYINIINNENKYYLVILDKSEIDDFTYKHIISSKELEEIVKISFYQNDPQYDDTVYNPEIKKAMEDYYRLKYKGNSPSLEKQRAYVISKTGLQFEYINKMTYRTFNFVYRACVDSELYMAQQLMKSSPKYEIKEPVVHPLFEKPKSKLSEVFSQTDEDLARKIQI